jgi:predicted RNA-binding Zn ribbon-like protein
MAFHWSERQFVGGALCLDFANTVIYPNDPERRFDRLVGAADLERWVESALRHAPLDAKTRRAVAAMPLSDARGDLRRARTLRDAADRLFRALAGDTPADLVPDSAELQQIAGIYRDGCQEAVLRLTDDGLQLVPSDEQGRIRGLLAVTAQSALTLALSPAARRIKACANCGWLFVDRSNNGRRRWCDMRVCGNRAKAKRHSARQRQA